MKRLAIVFGSTTGNTERVAKMLSDALGDPVTALLNVSDLTPTQLTEYDRLVLGVPTWNIGEMQEDWAAMLEQFGELPPECFAGKQVAIFGLGDFRGYPDTYVDAMGELWEAFQAHGASLVGTWPTEDYEFTGSKGMIGDRFIGMVIDIENQDGYTDERVAAWASQLRAEFPL